MSHRPAAGSLRFCGRETSSPPASSATVTLLPQATKHITCGQQPSNISARALLYAHCFLWGCSSMRSSASACACRGGSTLAWLMWRASRGGYDPFGFPLCHPRLCLPGWHCPFWLYRVNSKPGSPPSSTRGSQRDTSRAEVNYTTADTRGKQKVLLGGEEATWLAPACQPGYCVWALTSDQRHCKAPEASAGREGENGQGWLQGRLWDTGPMQAWRPSLPGLGVKGPVPGRAEENRQCSLWVPCQAHLWVPASPARQGIGSGG